MRIRIVRKKNRGAHHFLNFFAQSLLSLVLSFAGGQAHLAPALSGSDDKENGFAASLI